MTSRCTPSGSVSILNPPEGVQWLVISNWWNLPYEGWNVLREYKFLDLESIIYSRYSTTSPDEFIQWYFNHVGHIFVHQVRRRLPGEGGSDGVPASITYGVDVSILFFFFFVFVFLFVFVFVFVLFCFVFLRATTIITADWRGLLMTFGKGQPSAYDSIQGLFMS